MLYFSVNSGTDLSTTLFFLQVIKFDCVIHDTIMSKRRDMRAECNTANCILVGVFGEELCTTEVMRRNVAKYYDYWFVSKSDGLRIPFKENFE